MSYKTVSIYVLHFIILVFRSSDMVQSNVSFKNPVNGQSKQYMNMECWIKLFAEQAVYECGVLNQVNQVLNDGEFGH